MLEIEDFWKGVKPHHKPEKGFNGVIGYGCRRKTRSRFDKSQKRKAYREIRKYGFDLSEVWNLDCTIMSWLSDEFGGFFTICGSSDNWSNYDMEGNYVDFWENYKADGYIQNAAEWEKIRTESFMKHLKDLLDNASEEDKKKIAEFCSPRLRKLADITHGWPPSDDFHTFEDWKKEIYNMADKLDEGEYSEYFISYFFSLWD